MSVTMEVQFDRLLKVYHDGDAVKGCVVVTNSYRSAIAHNGISFNVEGVAALTLSAKSVGRIEALYNTVKPINLYSYTTELKTQNKLPEGTTKIPFQFVLKPKGNALYETYHGVFVNVQYLIKCLMKRPLLNKDVTAESEFLVEYREGEKAATKPVPFLINPNSIKNVANKATLPRFSVRGKLNSTNCCISRPFTGELTIELAETPIRSIELQLMRVETVGCAEGFAKEVSEIQNIEIGSGDVCHGLTIPIYMIFPRLFSCPTLESTNFKVEFELNIAVVFTDDRLIMETFPLKITRF